MAKCYVTITNDDWWDDSRAIDSLAKTIYEDHELIDIGILDPHGNKVMAHKRPDPIGFIRWKGSSNG